MHQRFSCVFVQRQPSLGFAASLWVNLNAAGGVVFERCLRSCSSVVQLLFLCRQYDNFDIGFNGNSLQCRVRGTYNSGCALLPLSRFELQSQSQTNLLDAARSDLVTLLASHRLCVFELVLSVCLPGRVPSTGTGRTWRARTIPSRSSPPSGSMALSVRLLRVVCSISTATTQHWAFFVLDAFYCLLRRASCSHSISLLECPESSSSPVSPFFLIVHLRWQCQRADRRGRLLARQQPAIWPRQSSLLQLPQYADGFAFGLALPFARFMLSLRRAVTLSFLILIVCCLSCPTRWRERHV